MESSPWKQAFDRDLVLESKLSGSNVELLDQVCTRVPAGLQAHTQDQFCVGLPVRHRDSADDWCAYLPVRTHE